MQRQGYTPILLSFAVVVEKKVISSSVETNSASRESVSSVTFIMWAKLTINYVATVRLTTIHWSVYKVVCILSYGSDLSVLIVNVQGYCYRICNVYTMINVCMMFIGNVCTCTNAIWRGDITLTIFSIPQYTHMRHYYIM